MSSPSPPDTAAAIELRGLSKRYEIYSRPADRLKQLLFRRWRQADYFRAFWALQELDLVVPRGEVLGLVGRNGAGKSTLLQLICGTLTPTAGSVRVHGRVSALLELGAGFNPEFSGRENVFLAASILGLSHAEIARRFDGIVAFSGVGRFIDQPVKTYSSGMYVRLAFAVATSVDPDILVVDEALSVGDGEFARKSFDRIMALKSAGTTIVFCSHSLYEVEKFCDRVLWLDQGQLMRLGPPREVIQAYGDSLLDDYLPREAPSDAPPAAEAPPATAVPPASSAGADPASAAPPDVPAVRTPQGTAQLLGVEVRVAGTEGRQHSVDDGGTTLDVHVRFRSDPTLPAPTVGVVVEYGAALALTSDTTLHDQLVLPRDSAGCGEVSLHYPSLPLRKGEYHVSIYLACERAFHIYDKAERIVSVVALTDRAEPGIINLPHQWRLGP